jgi:hypothetical protein
VTPGGLPGRLRDGIGLIERELVALLGRGESRTGPADCRLASLVWVTFLTHGRPLVLLTKADLAGGDDCERKSEYRRCPPR